MNIYAYTVTIDGQKYRAYAPAYRWADVCEYFDLTVNLSSAEQIQSSHLTPK